MFTLIAADPKDATDWTSQGPAVVMGIVLSGLFLKALSEIIKHFAAKDTERNDAEKARATALEHLGDDCHAFQKQLQNQQDERSARTDKIVQDLAEIATRAKVALEQVERLLDERASEKHEPTTNDEGPKRQNRRANG